MLGITSALKEEALTHPSMGLPHYQRLEFLGDRVLGLAVAAWLFKLYPQAPEGELARRHTALVRTGTLATVARELDLEPQIRRGVGETAPVTESVLADVVEALIGAMFLEKGMDAAGAWVQTLLEPHLDAAQGEKDAKTRLQEELQAKGHPLPLYQTLAQTGPDHAPMFTIRLSCALGEAEAEASSKQLASQLAAAKLLETLQADMKDSE
jgi:ribonuclease-3